MVRYLFGKSKGECRYLKKVNYQLKAKLLLYRNKTKKPFEEYSLNGFSIDINLYTFCFTLILNNHLFHVIKHVLRRYFV